ncbi:MAG: hypothetical protein HW406_415 [Candidatus Brocadiaceae bacterium]|nr:hypothetical protein [Candidatus Brocadiaceae bacterium]
MSAQSNDKGMCKFAATHPRPLMVGQASSPDIMMTSGDACPTNEGSLKVAAEGSLIHEAAFFVLHALAILFPFFLSIKKLSKVMRTSATKRGN